MMQSIFKKTLFISLAGHLAFFGIFNFSFGVKLPQLNQAPIAFLGDILQGVDFKSGITKSKFFIKNLQPDTKELDRSRLYYSLDAYHFKPQAILSAFPDKVLPQEEEAILLRSPKLESSIMLYPALPSHFLLYFKDRQIVHIELMFKTDPAGHLYIKRKISSGNPEADLLTMRYITRYLFMQKAQFLPQSWQTVKIELSPKD